MSPTGALNESISIAPTKFEIYRSQSLNSVPIRRIYNAFFYAVDPASLPLLLYLYSSCTLYGSVKIQFFFFFNSLSQHLL
mmetsp:Transcript_35723/g.75213  ORF Transcript_35723/g.75213 Transcript_35723/m.75213 type:complete len:80 (+) Transcript_35723:2442-2681(+)